MARNSVHKYEFSPNTSAYTPNRNIRDISYDGDIETYHANDHLRTQYNGDARLKYCRRCNRSVRKCGINRLFKDLAFRVDDCFLRAKFDVDIRGETFVM
jgi:hypothetical protein